MKILIGCNTLTSIAQPIHASMMQFWFRLGRNFPEHQFVSFTPRRLSIDNMRNNAAKAALESECDYLMFVDDDVLIDPINTFPSLLNACEKHGAQIAMAETYIRGFPFEPMFFKSINHNLIPFRDFKQHIDKNGLVECDAIGFSCVLIDCDLIRKVLPPYFVTGPLQTEDVYFCMKAKAQLGNDKVKIVVDTKVPTGHMLDPEPVHHQNRQFLIEYYEKACPELKTQLDEYKQSVDRGTEYAAKVEQVVKKRQLDIKSRLRQQQSRRRSQHRP